MTDGDWAASRPESVVLMVAEDEALTVRVRHEPGYVLVTVAGELDFASVAGLRERHQVRVEPVVIDLAGPDAPERLKVAVDNLDLSPDVLVNNAGVGAIGTFADLSLTRQLEMVHVNVEALVALTSLFSLKNARHWS